MVWIVLGAGVGVAVAMLSRTPATGRRGRWTYQDAAVGAIAGAIVVGCPLLLISRFLP